MQPNAQDSTNKVTAIITIALLVGAAIYYFYYSGASTATDPGATLSSVDSGAASTGNVGQDVLTLLNEIHSLKIDTTFFKTAAYESLIDFSVAIPSTDVGRTNPFSPFAGSAPTLPSSSNPPISH